MRTTLRHATDVLTLASWTTVEQHWVALIHLKTMYRHLHKPANGSTEQNYITPPVTELMSYNIHRKRLDLSINIHERPRPSHPWRVGPPDSRNYCIVILALVPC